MRVQLTEGAGASLFATRDFDARELILEERAAVWVLSTSEHALFALAEAVLAAPGMADRLLEEFGRRVAPCDLDQQVCRAFLRRVLPTRPAASVPALLRVLAALNVRTRHPHGVTGVFPTLNYINHSCEHNAVMSTPISDPRVVRLVARRPIAAGEEIAISYVGVDVGEERDLPLASVLPAADRQRTLMEQYGFRCKCRACALENT